MTVTKYNPAGLRTPTGEFSHVSRVKASELLFIAGQVSPGRDMAEQCDGVFKAIHAALASAGAGWDNIAQLTTYLTDADQIPAFKQWRQDNFPAMFGDGGYPPNTLVVIAGLAAKDLLIEVQATAAL